MTYAATIGFFDGVHRGHQFLLSQLLLLSQRQSVEPMVITFSSHPLQVLSPQHAPLLLTLPQERLSHIKTTGINEVRMLQFPAFQHYTAVQFLQYLHTQGVRYLLMGYDHRFGSDRLTDHSQYKLLAQAAGINIHFLEEYNPEQLHISSTQIRTLISNGNIAAANQLLGYPYSLQGTVTQGRQIGRTIGFPTANLIVDSQKLLPQNGVYAATTTLNNKTYSTLLNIGNNPTVNGQTQTVEAHIINFSGNLYSQPLTVNILKHLRSEITFSSLDELKAQILRDKQNLSL